MGVETARILIQSRLGNFGDLVFEDNQIGKEKRSSKVRRCAADCRHNLSHSGAKDLFAAFVPYERRGVRECLQATAGRR